MLSSRFATRLVSLVVLLSVTACANSPNSKNIEQILAADPRLQEKSGTSGASDTPEQQPQAKPNTSPPVGTPGVNAIASLPADFPTEIRYPNAQLVEVTPPTQNNQDSNSAAANQPQQTRWVTSDPSNFVLDFYQKQFKAKNWDLNQQQSDAPGTTIQARRNDLQVTVSIVPSTGTNTQTNPTPTPTQAEAGTQFIIQYQRNSPSSAFSGEPQTQNQPSPATNTAQTATPGNQNFTDLNSAPSELRQYITDLASLGVLQLEQTGVKSNTDILTQFQPGKTISHREFARWLFAANNQIHANRPSLQIRAASPTAPPAFQDVPPSDPDFPAIQGLAEAGLIPSRLSGDATAVLFRPDAPLTREQLILWKVPLDTRQALPNATVDAVRESWGFQDVAKIDLKALRAILADFQNGEQSNIRRAFGYTTLFQPKRPVTRAEAAAAIWYFGNASEGISAQEALKLDRQQNQPQPQPSSSPQPIPSSSP